MGEMLQTWGAVTELLLISNFFIFDLVGIECNKIVFTLCSCVSG